MTNLKYGSKGESVAIIQNLLNAHGSTLVIDGDFGLATEKAVIEFQKKTGLNPDGIVGIKTHLALNRDNISRFITQADYEKAATELGVAVNVVKAFAKVESRGAGFFDYRPAILFERHVFYRLLNAKHGKAFADRHATSRPNIVNVNTGGYQGGISEYVRLNVAATIDKECAYCSASWGMFQIMGENWQALGYESIHDFVAKMNESEANHLDAFVRFCKTKKGLLDALQKGDWDKVFTLYNGKAYKKHGYDYKFLAELRRLDGLRA